MKLDESIKADARKLDSVEISKVEFWKKFHFGEFHPLKFPVMSSMGKPSSDIDVSAAKSSIMRSESLSR